MSSHMENVSYDKKLPEMFTANESVWGHTIHNWIFIWLKAVHYIPSQSWLDLVNMFVSGCNFLVNEGPQHIFTTSVMGGASVVWSDLTLSMTLLEMVLVMVLPTTYKSLQIILSSQLDWVSPPSQDATHNSHLVVWSVTVSSYLWWKADVESVSPTCVLTAGLYSVVQYTCGIILHQYLLIISIYLLPPPALKGKFSWIISWLSR